MKNWIYLFLCSGTCCAILVFGTPLPPISDRQRQLTAAANVEEAHIDCSLVPPALWCFGEIREKCGNTELCLRHDAAVHHRPMHIQLLYESLCPDSQRFIRDTLYDVYTRFKPYIELELVPYGNARILENGQISCQHGEKECLNNKFQSCVIAYIADPMPFIYCLESLLAEKLAFEDVSKLCFNFFRLNQHTHDNIIQCFNGTEGDDLQKAAAQKTAAVWPNKHQFVPWIVVNNASIGSMQFLQNALPALICESRASDEYVAECDLWQ